MISYHGDGRLKTDLTAEIRRHREADQVVQGTYGETILGRWRGCSVGCSLRSLDIVQGREPRQSYAYSHAAYAPGLGIPAWLAHLVDVIHEGLPPEEAVLWPEQFAEAVPVGVDLEPVRYHFGAWLMRLNLAVVAGLDLDEGIKSEVTQAIEGVLELHVEAIRTGHWDDEAAWSVAESAWSAARSAEERGQVVNGGIRAAARSAAELAESAAWAARPVAESAAWAARSAAWSAARAARPVAESARSARWEAWSKISLALLGLLLLAEARI